MLSLGCLAVGSHRLRTQTGMQECDLNLSDKGHPMPLSVYIKSLLADQNSMSVLCQCFMLLISNKASQDMLFKEIVR